jgi:UDP-N-acetylglucosamine 2-epimerase (non-hydrolysing)
MKRILFIAGTRPNYMKVYPLWKEMEGRSEFDPLLVHTGQHYDYAMSNIFFKDLGLPEPDVFLGIGSGSHGEQTGRVMIALEPVLEEKKPDLIIVVGDVNSTMAAALVAVKMGIRIAHVEAGLRSFDRSMPEEINRIVTDSISHLLFTSCKDADKNLIREGIPPYNIHFVGNIMIDSLIRFLPKATESDILERLKLNPKQYAAVTLHRPSNVDDANRLRLILENLQTVAKNRTVVFPVHPRTRKMIEDLHLQSLTESFFLSDPLGYLEFLCLMSQSEIVVTDSGGIQEETTFLGIPCLTLRPNTERPITIEQGTNRLVDLDKQSLATEVESALKSSRKTAPVIEKWDGQTTHRILEVLRAV